MEEGLVDLQVVAHDAVTIPSSSQVVDVNVVVRDHHEISRDFGSVGQDLRMRLIER